MPDFIGRDPESNSVECPAVFVSPETGDFYFRGKTVTDPAVLTEMSQHVGRAEDESDVWLPARMAPVIREALEGYERGRIGPGQHSFWEILDHTHTSLIRFEMRDSYDETEEGFAEWKATGDISTYDWGEHLDRMRAAAARGVRIRRVRVISEPVSDYIRWEHACTSLNVEAGEDIRWLPRTKAADPDAARRGLLGLRPPGRAVELSARRRHQPASLHLQLRPPDHPRHHRGIRDRLAAGNTARGV